MRRLVNCALGLSISMLLVGLAPLALAQPTAAKQSTHAELIKTLRSAHSLLVHADHDYDGHRAKAAEAVHLALKELGYRHKKAQPPVTPGVGGVVPPAAAKAAKAKIPMPQATSDAHLREAQQILQGALTHINGKHPKATAKVQTAIAEINTALAIK